MYTVSEIVTDIHDSFRFFVEDIAQKIVRGTIAEDEAIKVDGKWVCDYISEHSDSIAKLEAFAEAVNKVEALYADQKPVDRTSTYEEYREYMASHDAFRQLYKMDLTEALKSVA